MFCIREMKNIGIFGEVIEPQPSAQIIMKDDVEAIRKDTEGTDKKNQIKPSNSTHFAPQSNRIRVWAKNHRRIMHAI
jgi:hypothetical protein